METSIEVRYAGVVVGRTSHAREVDTARGRGLFVGIAEPLPVGTPVTLKIGDVVREAHVDEVVEAADPSAVGMRVVFDVATSAAAPMTAAPAPIPEAPPVAAVEDEGPSAAAETEASEAISAPLSLAEPGGGGGKRRRKRR